jgi:hypothetical protein
MIERDRVVTCGVGGLSVRTGGKSERGACAVADAERAKFTDWSWTANVQPSDCQFSLRIYRKKVKIKVDKTHSLTVAGISSIHAFTDDTLMILTSFESLRF